MTKEEVVDMMLFSINTDNRELCKKAGMSESDTESQISQSQPSLHFIIENMYDRMKDGGIIV